MEEFVPQSDQDNFVIINEEAEEVLASQTLIPQLTLSEVRNRVALSTNPYQASIQHLYTLNTSSECITPY